METVVYFGGRQRASAFLGAAETLSLGTPPRERRCVVLERPEEAMALLGKETVHALVLDTQGDGRPFAQSPAGELLGALFPPGAVELLLPRDRVVALLDDGRDAIAVAHALGVHGLDARLVAPTPAELRARLDAIFSRRGKGRIALCLAGGGIEGLLYELGVLRALDAFLVDRKVADFDLICGISAGAVIGAFLANGVGPDEIAAGLAGESRRIDPIRRRDLFDPNFREAGARLVRLGGELARGGRGATPVISSLMRAIPSALFAGDRLRAWLHRELTKPGMSDSFDGLRRPLLVGATDQDSSEHVVFGAETHRHVALHRAVRASAALAPFYAPERIDGRYYVDGAFTRTTNMRVAVEHGATLVVLVDPLVPVRAREPGTVHARGGAYATMQGLKSLIHGRFDKAVRAIREMYPDAAFWLFSPERDEMRVLAGSPMKYFYRREVEDIAFEATCKKLRVHLPAIARDFAQHGARLRDPGPPVERVPHREGAIDAAALGVGV